MRAEVSVIIPAFNEEATIGQVIDAAKASLFVNEVIVIDDGSTDRTVSISKKKGALVISLDENMGKGQAMEAGVKKSNNQIILFLDADLLGLTTEHVDRIIKPVIQGKAGMNVGIRDRGEFITRITRDYLPLIGGERAMKKELWLSVPAKFKTKHKIEPALNYYCRRIVGQPVTKFIEQGVGVIPKEKKRGIIAGLISRVKMTWGIFFTYLEIYFWINTKRALKKLFMLE